MNDEMHSHDHDHPHDDHMDVPASSHASTKTSSGWKQHLQTPKGKIMLVLVVLAVVLGGLTQQVYARPVTDTLVRTVSQVIPYPALSVNGQTVSMKEFLVEYDALQSYFSDLGQQTPPADQLEVAIADTLINKIVIVQLARAYGVELDQEQVDAYYQDVVAQQESEEAFIQNLADTFGWTPEEFRARIVESIVLATQMTEAITQNEDLQGPRAQLIADASTRVRSGEDFATIAQEIHAQFSGLEGDLGYVSLSVIPQSWASQVEVLEIGQFTEVIELAEGYAIFKLEDRTDAGEDTQLHLLSITVPKVTLQELVDDYLETAKVKRYVGEE